MDDLTIQQNALPAMIEDLSKFVLVATEKVQAIRAEIRAIDKLGLAKEVHDQKVKEAQMLAEAMIDAEVRIGQLTPRIPKASGGNRRSTDFKSSPGETFENPNTSFSRSNEVTKERAVNDLGFSKKQVHEFEQMAKYPEIVEQAKEYATENNTVVTKKQVLQLIKGEKAASKAIEVEYQLPTPVIIDAEYETAINEIDVSAKIRDAIYAVSLALPDSFVNRYAEIYINQNTDIFTKDDLINEISEAINKLNSLKAAMYTHKSIREVKK